MSTATDISLEDRYIDRMKALVARFDERLVHDRYRVIDIINQGSSGAVFQAYDEKLQREVALKIFSGEYESKNDKDTVYDLYLRESRIAASLSHPNIVAIYDIGVLEDAPDKNPFIVMAYIAGSLLHDRIESRTLSVQEIVRIFYALADALDYAHSRKQAVLHRDIKPKNIIISDNNKPVLIDFGISRFVGAGTTTACMFKGSAAFMAPELLHAYRKLNSEAVRRALQPAIDLYAFGATFYRALVGENPLPGASSYEVMLAARNMEPKAPSQLNSTVPLELERIVMSLLAKKPEERMSAGELRKQLRPLIENSEVLTPNVETKVAEQDSDPKVLASDDDSVDESDDILNDEKFKDVEELQTLRRQPEAAPAAQPTASKSDIDAEKIRQLVELIQGQQAENSKKFSLTSVPAMVGAGILIVLVLAFFGSPKKQPKQATKSSSALQEKLATLPLRPPPLAEETAPNTGRGVGYPGASSAAKPVSFVTNNPAAVLKAAQPNYRSTGNELVVFSRKAEKKQEMVHGVPAGSEIREVYLLNKVVSFNIATPVKASLRLDFKLEGQDDIILPRDSIFVGEAQVGKSNDRVIINFFQVITPDQKTIQISGTALMEDGSLGLVGNVRWPKGKSPVLQASKDILGTAGRVAIGGLDADTYGERIGKSIGVASVNNTGKILQEDYQKLPEITVDAMSPLKIYLNEGF